MHIAIDAHSVGTGLAGNETYAANLVEALAEVDAENLYTIYVTRKEAERRFEGRWPNVRVQRTLPHTPLLRVPFTLSAELRLRPVDILHVQYTAPPLAPCPVVATIHDLSFEHLPETFKRRSWMQLRLTVRRTARRASHVIAPSEFTRRDLIDTYRLDPSRVTAIPLAASALVSSWNSASITVSTVSAAVFSRTPARVRFGRAVSCSARTANSSTIDEIAVGIPIAVYQ